jgi:hypothetical protein
VRATALACLALAVPALALPASASAGSRADGAASWSWRAGAIRLPVGCSALAGSKARGDGRSHLVTPTTLGLKVAAGAGLACAGHAARSGRLEVHVRVPRAAGLVARIGIRASGDGWSGLTVPASSAPAYVTNGPGERAGGVTATADLTGRFHSVTIAWTPTSTSVAVDGRAVYRGPGSDLGARWPVVSLVPESPSAAPSPTYLLVDAVTVDAVRSSADAALPTSSSGRGAAAAAGRTAVSGGGALLLGPSPVATTPDRSAVGGPVALPAGDTTLGAPALIGSLDSRPLGTPWMVGGICVALGVLAGIVRAARGARREAAAAQS